ncbi:MAG: phage holin family protein [Ilumatobacteraceae bacterium]
MSRTMRVLLTWACNAAAILVAVLLIDGIRMDDEWRVIAAGAVFGLVNWAVKPLVTLLALPLIVVTLGIALFFVNLLMLYITSWVMPDFHIDSFGAAIAGTIVIWLVNVILHAVLGLEDRGKGRT